MERHLRGCPACSAQKAAEEELGRLLAREFEADTPEEARAAARVTEAWRRSIPVPELRTPQRAAPAPWISRRRLLSASAAVGVAVTLFAISAITGPIRALAGVKDAMARAQRFHLRIEAPGSPMHYEGWGQRGVGARLEEWQGKRLQRVIVDDGQTLRSYYPRANVVRQGETRMKEIYRQAAGFNATRILRQAAKGKLFDGQEWLGEAKAREAARVKRHGMWQRRIQVDLEGGFFERMIVYADQSTDRLTQANLYTDSNDPEEEPTARIFFSYPERLDPQLFRFHPPAGAHVEHLDPEQELP
jgi:hypothetical protein